MPFFKKPKLTVTISTVACLLVFAFVASNIHVYSEGGCSESLSCCEAKNCLEVLEWTCVTSPVGSSSDCDYFICCTGGGGIGDSINDSEANNYLILIDGVWI